MISNRSNRAIQLVKKAINEGKNVQRVRARIKQEKMRDKKRFDDMLDDARTADTRAKNRETNEQKVHDKCGTPECCGQCDAATNTEIGTDEYANYTKRITPGQ